MRSPNGIWPVLLRVTIPRRFLAYKDQGRQDKKKWKEIEPCFATDFENHEAAIQRQNGNQQVSN